MNYIKALEQSIKYNRLLQADCIDVVYIVTKYSNDKVNCHITHNYSRDDYGIQLSDSYEVIKQKALKLTKPKYIKPTKICVNLIGNKAYINKKVEVVIESIHNGYVVDTDGVEHDINDVWIKE